MDQIALLSGKNVYGLRLGTVCGDSPEWRKGQIINALVTDALQIKHVTVVNPEHSRGILGLNDMCRVITTLVKDQNYAKKAGTYNIASFNSTVGDLGRYVSCVFEADLSEKPADANGKDYDLRLNCGKFERAFDFEFADTVESIVGQVANYHKRTNEMKREESKEAGAEDAKEGEEVHATHHIFSIYCVLRVARMKGTSLPKNYASTIYFGF
jgi:nucleoside-diphosphate-sugar epimerase